MIAEYARPDKTTALGKVLVEIALISWNWALETFRLAKKPPAVLLVGALRHQRTGAKAVSPLRLGLPSKLDIPKALPARDERVCLPRKAGTWWVKVAVIRPPQSWISTRAGRSDRNWHS